MFRAVILLYITMIGVHTAIVQSDTPLPEILQYSCYQSKSEIRIPVNVNNLTNYEVIAYKFKPLTSMYNSISVPCEVIKIDDNIKIGNCWNTVVNVVPTQVKPLSNQSEKIVGGKGSVMYTLQCIGPANDNETVHLEIEKSVAFAGSMNAHDEGTQNGYAFTMDITDKTHNLSKDRFLIGDLLHLKIYLSGTNDDVKWRVNSCSALSGNMVINFIGSNVVTNTQIAEVTNMTNTTILQTSQSFEVDLYAFHALNSNKVVYSCELDVCRGSACNLQRRRRSVSDPQLQQKHTKVIYVYDNVEDITALSSHPGRPAPSYVRTMLAVTALVLMLI